MGPRRAIQQAHVCWLRQMSGHLSREHAGTPVIGPPRRVRGTALRQITAAGLDQGVFLAAGHRLEQEAQMTYR